VKLTQLEQAGAQGDLDRIHTRGVDLQKYLAIANCRIWSLAVGNHFIAAVTRQECRSHCLHLALRHNRRHRGRIS
jgi:hypothetical protein